MTRSSWKAPHRKIKLEDNLNRELTRKQFKNQITTYDRSVTITPEMLSKGLSIHNGKSFVGLNVTENHVGFKLGEFVLTKKRVSHKKRRS